MFRLGIGVIIGDAAEAHKLRYVLGGDAFDRLELFRRALIPKAIVACHKASSSVASEERIPLDEECVSPGSGRGHSGYDSAWPAPRDDNLVASDDGRLESLAVNVPAGSLFGGTFTGARGAGGKGGSAKHGSQEFPPPHRLWVHGARYVIPMFASF